MADVKESKVICPEYARSQRGKLMFLRGQWEAYQNTLAGIRYLGEQIVLQIAMQKQAQASFGKKEKQKRLSGAQKRKARRTRVLWEKERRERDARDARFLQALEQAERELATSDTS
jgi:hypothetical protein